MVKIHGIPVILYEKTETGKDAFGAPVYEEKPVIVENVLVYPATADDITTSTDLYGKKAVYTLGIPKGDGHKWEDSTIEFFAHKFRSFGPAQQGIEDLIPLEWNKKIMVEAYG